METLCKLYLELANIVPADCISSREKKLLAQQIAPTPAEIELMFEGAQAGTIERTHDGELRTYFPGFSLTALAEHLSRELAQRDD
jgi:hypothetical protein